MQGASLRSAFFTCLSVAARNRLRHVRLYSVQSLWHTALVCIFLSCCWSAAAKASHHVARSCQSTVLPVPTILDSIWLSCARDTCASTQINRTALRAREQSSGAVVIPGSKQQGTEQNMLLNVLQCLQSLHTACRVFTWAASSPYC